MYRPADSPNLTVTLPAGEFSVTWFDIAKGREVAAETVTHAGSRHAFTAPFDGDAVLHLKVVK